MAKAKGIKFSKNDWRTSELYSRQPDLVEAVLDDENEYSREEVEKLIEEYLNKEVK